jgi:hypothetical protein
VAWRVPHIFTEPLSQILAQVVSWSANIADDRPDRRALRTLRTNADITILPADKGNAAVVLNTSDYNRKIWALLGALTYRTLAKDPTEAVERKTTLILKKSSLTEEIIQQLRPQGSRLPRLYGLPKIHKEGAPLFSPLLSVLVSPDHARPRLPIGSLASPVPTYSPLVRPVSLPWMTDSYITARFLSPGLPV